MRSVQPKHNRLDSMAPGVSGLGRSEIDDGGEGEERVGLEQDLLQDHALAHPRRPQDRRVLRRQGRPLAQERDDVHEVVVIARKEGLDRSGVPLEGAGDREQIGNVPILAVVNEARAPAARIPRNRVREQVAGH
jgi:hypothetical protein